MKQSLMTIRAESSAVGHLRPQLSDAANQMSKRVEELSSRLRELDAGVSTGWPGADFCARTYGAGHHSGVCYF